MSMLQNNNNNLLFTNHEPIKISIIVISSCLVCGHRVMDTLGKLLYSTYNFFFGGGEGILFRITEISFLNQ